MQTFLPNQSFQETAECLDYRRLGKQRVETKQIYMTLTRLTPKRGWANHPAVLMWKGHEHALLVYGLIMCREWIKRGYNSTIHTDFIEWLKPYEGQEVKYPWWLGHEKFHLSHRSNLLRKQPEYYSKFGWGVPDDLKYLWPIQQPGEFVII